MRTASGFDDKDAQTDRDIFRECKEFVDQVVDSESQNRSRAIDWLKFRDGDQWPQTLYAERELDGRLSLTINHTDTFVSRIENALRQQRPRIKCHPVGDGADVDKAEVINGLIRHIENRSQASIAYDTGGSSALSIGWGYWRIVAEYIDEKSFEQELKIVAIRNPFTVYRDPASVMPDGSDAVRYVISEKIKRTKYRQLYPNASNIAYDAGGVGDEMLDWESPDEIRLAEYFRIVEKPEWLYKMADGSTIFESELPKDEDLAAMNLKLAMENGKPVRRKSSRKQVQWFRINGREVVDRRDLPGKYIPIIACQGNTLDVNGRVSRSGMIKNLIEPARMVNYWETMKTERLALAPKAEWTTYEGVIEGHPEWHDANRKSYSVLVGKAISGPNGELLPLPTKQQPAGIESGYAEAMQSAYSALMAMAGQPHDPGQDAKGQVISGIALEERRELADVTHFQYYDNQTRSIAFTGTIILDLLRYYYDTQRMQRIIGEDGKPQMVTLNERVPDEANPAIWAVKNDMKIGQYSVVMDTGPGYDTKRQEGSQKLIDLLKTPLGEVVAQKGPDLAIRGLDTAYSEELADRVAIQVPQELEKIVQTLPARAQNIVKSMGQQITQLQQQLQAAQMDIKHGLTKTLHQEATKLQIEHLRDARAEHDTQIKDDTQRFDTEVKSHTAIGVAEINAGAKLIDTGQQAAHQKELAKITAESAVRAEKSN